MKVEFEFHWDGKDLKIVNKDFVNEQCQQFQPGYLDGTVAPQFQWKTGSQLGYLYGEIGPKALLGYRARGVNIKTKEMAVAYLALEPEIDFTEKIVDEFTGGILGRVPKRISGDKASRHELSEFMNDCITFIEVELGVEVQSPEDYKKLNK